MRSQTEFTDTIITALTEQPNRSSMNSKDPLRVHQIEARSLLKEIEFPSTKNEEWRYCDVSKLLAIETPQSFQSVQNISRREIEKCLFPAESVYQIVFVNGVLQHELSVSFDSESLTLLPLSFAIEKYPSSIESYLAKAVRKDENYFTALNNAFLNEGVFIQIGANTTVDKPIHILNVTIGDGAINQPHNIIILKREAKLTLIENYISLDDDSYFVNHIDEIYLGENAILEHIKIQDESTNAFHISHIDVEQYKSSRYFSGNICFGASMNRNNITARLNAEGADARLAGLYLPAKDQLIDNHTLIDHVSPHCTSDELYKGVLSGVSRAVFNGKVIVRKDAQKTNAFQHNKNILLSRKARVDTKPQLEIFADDVKCTHGATVGQLDQDAIFYLQSRGLSLESAKGMLISAFAENVLENITFAPFREYLNIKIESKLSSTEQ